MVVFLSDATDLVPEQVAAGTHLYETDLQSGTTTLVDVNTSGVGAVDNVDKPVYGADGTYVVENTPSVSADGRYVVFTAAANGLTSSPAVSSGTITNVYVRDMVAGTTTLVSADVAGSDGGNGNSADATISADGSEVVFQSDASNLVATDTNNATDVFVRNLTTGVTSLVSANMSNADSGDFESLRPGAQRRRQPRCLPESRRRPPVGPRAQPLGQCLRARPDDRRDDADQRQRGGHRQPRQQLLAAGRQRRRPLRRLRHRQLAPQVYVRDTQAGTTALASVNLAGTPDANRGNLDNPTLSADGQVIAFV